MPFSRFALSAARRALRSVSLCVGLLAASQLPAAEIPGENPAWQQQRQIYLDARTALLRGDVDTAGHLALQLQDYPLQPYLDHALLVRNLRNAAPAEVEHFLARHDGSVLATRLARQWLDNLAAAERWPEAIAIWRPEVSGTETTCHILKARHDSGDETALDAVPPLWNVARSQPNGCDPLFAAWIAAGRLTPALAWERFGKVLRAGDTRLARYLSTLMPAREQALAETWLSVRQQPALLRDPELLPAQAPEREEILHHGLQRLSLQNAPLALELWRVYDALASLSPEEGPVTLRYIIQRLLFQGAVAEAEAQLLENPALRSDVLLEWVLRDALKQQDWTRFDTWLALLPETTRATERWQYWEARSLMQRGTTDATHRALTLHADLARTRSFYGFLSADLLGTQYDLVDRPFFVGSAELSALMARPAIARAYELYRIGEESDAQREWQDGIRGLDQQSLIGAGRLAEQWGWHRNGIQAMIQAGYWDDLQVRFPLAHAELVGSAAADTALTSHFVFAVARQESAFIADARSSAGAMGLMQLLPSTARETAQRNGLPFASNLDLLRPEINIPLGSRYLSMLVQQFNGNRILAAAAYNAGPNRVRQWLNSDEDSRLPFDIWIETIPFGETRGYVQNVLAYSVIYGYRLGDSLPLVTDEEADRLL